MYCYLYRTANFCFSCPVFGLFCNNVHTEQCVSNGREQSKLQERKTGQTRKSKQDVRTLYDNHSRTQLVCPHKFASIHVCPLSIRSHCTYPLARLDRPDNRLCHHRLACLVCTYRRRNQILWFGRIF